MSPARARRPAPPLALSLLAAPLAAQVPEVVNAPVCPEAIYVVREGPLVGLSVIDLNGFGAGTGDPTFDPTYQTFAEGDSNYPNNPNVRYQGSLLFPPLAPGTNTRDGGSSGVFTLTRNSLLDDLQLGAAGLGAVGDVMIGHSLDSLISDGAFPFGCNSGGGNLCAVNPVRVLEFAVDASGDLLPAAYGGELVHTLRGGENPISWAPHPNPPALDFPPLCADPFLPGREPTSADSAVLGLANLLAPGDPFGDPLNGIPPSGLLGVNQRSWFFGPSLPQSDITACQPFQYRQQVGHFLYVADRTNDRVLVVSSNSLRVLAEIAVEDPTELAMSPNVDLLAVSQRALDRIAFVDIDPGSATFHRLVAATPVGDAPTGIAWDPGNEDILVCNEGEGSLSILSAATLQVRKVVDRGLEHPFAVAITQRQIGFGYDRGVYLAYVLDRNGRVSLFESGPDGPNGWGFDDIVGRTSFAFRGPKAIQPDPLRLTSGVWIAHERQLASDGSWTGLEGGAVSNLVLDSTTAGRIRLQTGERPNLRGLSFRVERSIGSDQLTGTPTDLAFDDLRNRGALPNVTSPFSAAAPARLNGKSQVKELGSLGIRPATEPLYLFAAVREGAVDVIELASGLRVDTNAFHGGVQSIPAPGAARLAHYFRQ